jgi:preprotein translocase subunit SecA
MVRLKMPEGEAIEHPLVSRSLESAQRKVEQRNFDIRKQLLEYDDVSNDQRKVIYQQRNELLDSEDISETITAMRQGQIHDTFRLHIPAESVEEQWDRRAGNGAGRRTAPQAADWRMDQGRANSWATTTSSSACSMPAMPPTPKRRAQVDAAAWPASSAMSCCRAWTATGASTCRRSTTCARASTCAAMRRRIRSRNTSARPSNCSRPAADRAQRGHRLLMTVEVRSEEQIEEAEAPPQLENVQYHHADYDEALAAPPSPRRRMPVERPRPRSAATIPVPAAAARSTSTATAS